MKNLVKIFFIILITTLIITSVIKLIKNFNFDYNEKNNHILRYSNHPTNSIPKWIKQDYILPQGTWARYNANDIFILGKKYFLIQTILNGDRCFYGMFFLKKIQNNNLVFKAEKPYSSSRLKQYSKLKSIKIATTIYSEEELFVLGKIQNCSEWVKIENN